MTEEEKRAALKEGDIIRVTSDAASSANPGIRYFGALCIVDEIRGWGVLAMIPVPWAGTDAIIPVRLAWEDFDLTGGKVPLAPRQADLST
jgi:hypothetical protein